MAFYQRLIEASRSTGRTRFVVLAPDPIEVTRENFAKHNLRPDEIHYVSPGALKIAGTPTLLLVDSQGIVRKRWLGLLTAEAEGEVVRAVN